VTDPELVSKKSVHEGAPTVAVSLSRQAKKMLVSSLLAIVAAASTSQALPAVLVTGATGRTGSLVFAQLK
jgi:hypothetical protein